MNMIIKITAIEMPVTFNAELKSFDFTFVADGIATVAELNDCSCEACCFSVFAAATN